MRMAPGPLPEVVSQREETQADPGPIGEIMSLSWPATSHCSLRGAGGGVRGVGLGLFASAAVSSNRIWISGR